MKTFFAILICFLAGPMALAQSEDVSICEKLLSGASHGILHDLSTSPKRRLALPAEDLVYLPQIEGLDPYGFFEEGMDSENENPLSVSNEDNELEIGVGGARFGNKTDASGRSTVSPLTYSKTAQRFLVQKRLNREGYDILVNVDRQANLAYVWMRVMEAGKLSEWDLAGTYGKLPAASLAGQKPVAAAYEGVLGDSEEGGPLLALLEETQKGFELRFYHGADIFGASAGSINVTAAMAQAIQAGDFQALDQQNSTDSATGNSVFFEKRGVDVEGKSRLKITMTTEAGELILTSGSSWRPEGAEAAARTPQGVFESQPTQNSYAPILESVVLAKDKVEGDFSPFIYHFILGELLELSRDQSCEVTQVIRNDVICVSSSGTRVEVGTLGATEATEGEWAAVTVRWNNRVEVVAFQDAKKNWKYKLKAH